MNLSAARGANANSAANTLQVAKQRPSAALSVGLACSRTTQYAPRARLSLRLATPLREQ